MSVFSLASFAAHLMAIEKDVEHLPQLIVAKAAVMLRKEIQSALGTYRYGWARLQPETIARKSTGNSPLLESGAFRDSIGISLGHDEAYVGTNDPKAKFFEFGTSRMPPRPVFVPASIRTEPKIHKMAEREVAKAFAGRGHVASELREWLHLAKELGKIAKEIAHEFSEPAEGERRRR